MIDREILAQVRRIQVRTNRMVTDLMAGGYTSVFRGSGIEFDEVREFAEGDDIRSVDWNVTARTGRPHVKKYVEERELTLLFLLDVSASMGFGTVRRGAERPREVREAAAEVCACLALTAARSNDKAGLVAFAEDVERYVPAKKGSRHALRLIREALALEAHGRGTDVVRALDFAARVQRKRAIVFVVSDFLGVRPGDFQRPLRRLARRHDVVAVRMVDPATVELPRAGLLYLRDAEDGTARWVDTSARRVRAAHREAVERWDAGLQDAFRRAGVDTLDVRTDRSVADPLVRFFRMRELRGMRG